MAHVARDGVKRFEAVAGDTEDGRIIGRNFPGRNEFLGDAHRHAPGGFGEDALGFGEQLDGVADFGVAFVLNG